MRSGAGISRTCNSRRNVADFSRVTASSNTDSSRRAAAFTWLRLEFAYRLGRLPRRGTGEWYGAHQTGKTRRRIDARHCVEHRLSRGIDTHGSTRLLDRRPFRPTGADSGVARSEGGGDRD